MSAPLPPTDSLSARSPVRPCALDGGAAGETPRSPNAELRFNARACGYARHAHVQRDMAAWLAQWLPQQAAGWRTPGSIAAPVVIDLGAGEGMFTRFLTPRFERVIALDAAERMVAAGRAQLPEAYWCHGDAWRFASLPGMEPLADLPRERALVSSSLMQWCAHPQDVLARWAGQCAPGTRMLHGFYVEPTLCEWREIFGDGAAIAWRSPQQWGEFFAQSGWRVLRQDFSLRRYVFASALALARSLHGTGATVATGADALPAGRYREKLRAYERAFAAVATEETTKEAAEAVAAAGDGGDDGDRGAGDAALQTSSAVYASWGFFRIEAERVC